ncbi:MAG: VOC family protein [Candidatus Cloacimonetes bacterium]|nr:VOC family protein [Candidatus Cloacimonadota bacterium]
MNCKIEWIEIPAPDLEKAKEFYSAIFGWKISEYSPDYLIFESGNMNGGMYKNRQPSDNGICFSITVQSIEETLNKIVKLGGQLVKEKYKIGKGLGFYASFSDPNGNVLELWAEK